MEDLGERAVKRLKKISKSALLVGVAASIAGTPEPAKAQSENVEDVLGKYGRIVLYNATQSEGGTVGRGGLVYDPASGQTLLCSIAHVTEGGPLMDDIFEPKTSGDDPIMCTVSSVPTSGEGSDVPEISTERLNEGDLLSMTDNDGDLVNFVVSEVEEDKVWFQPVGSQDEWSPSRGDSGSMVAKVDDGDVMAVGVYGDQSIEPNRDNPSQPKVTYYMVPFGS